MVACAMQLSPPPPAAAAISRNSSRTYVAAGTQKHPFITTSAIKKKETLGLFVIRFKFAFRGIGTLAILGPCLGTREWMGWQHLVTSLPRHFSF